MNRVVVVLLVLSSAVMAQPEGKRVYQKDSLGNVQHHKQSWVIKDGKLCPVDTIGNMQHHKPCLDVGSKEMEAPANSKK